MPTEAQEFFPDDTDWDGTDPSGGDVRKMLESLPNAVSTTLCQFGATGNKNIICDPYTTNATDSIADLDKFGWAINLDGADGMGAVDGDFQRRIASGTWTISGQVRASPAASLSAVTIHCRIYTFNADGSRTEIASGSGGGGLVTVAGVSYTITMNSVPEVLLSDDETIMVSFYINATGQVGGLNIVFDTGNGLVDDLTITLPAPGVRYRYLRTLAAILDGIVTIRKKVKMDLSASMVGFGELTRTITVSRTFSAVMAGQSTMDRLLDLHRSMFSTMTGISTMDRRLTLFRTFAAEMSGVATLKRVVKKKINAIMTGIATMQRRATLSRTFTVMMVGNASIAKKVKKELATTLLGRALGKACIPFRLIPDSDGTTVIVVED